ncbi:MAG TPA: bsaAI, partial [Candidatus Paceibacterota bacterium]|nr:bsaAI [Candidatus Paceibacterota bacterium]
EVKATCGSVPTPALLARRGLTKPHIGDTRISYLTGYDWKAHHRETGNLLGIVWDFLDGRPCIVAIFYVDTLSPEDWGRIVQPRDGGGRTTSVSIMTRAGVRKMYEGWVAVIEDARYTEFFNRYNRGELMAVPR